jgi:hypothetical protein
MSEQAAVSPYMITEAFLARFLARFGQGKLRDIRRSGREPATKAIKEFFGEEGRGLGFEVDGDPKDQWKYDLAWWARGDRGLLIRMVLALESEWNDQTEYVDNDFPKLVESRAELRVWFCHATNSDAAREHVAHCKDQITRFAGSQHGDAYLFIIFLWTPDEFGEFHIEPHVADVERPRMAADIAKIKEILGEVKTYATLSDGRMRAIRSDFRRLEYRVDLLRGVDPGPPPEPEEPGFEP